MIRRVPRRVKRKKRMSSRGWMVLCCKHLILLLLMIIPAVNGHQWLFKESRFTHYLGSQYSTSSANRSLCAYLCGQDVACAGFTVDPCVLYAELVTSCRSRAPEEPQSFLKYVTAENNMPGWRIGVNLTCPDSFEFSEATGSCYMYQDTTKARTWSQLQQECEGHGAHLLAVNNAEEHEWIKNYVPSKNPACRGLWTGGKANVPGSSTSKTDWSWELCGGIKQQANYFDWYGSEPNSLYENGLNENVIMVIRNWGFQFVDVAEDISSVNWYVHEYLGFICEISAA